MSHRDDIEAICVREDLTPEEKRAGVYEVKSRAFRAVARQAVNRPWTTEEGVTINITRVMIDDRSRLVVDCEAWRDGQRLVLDLPFVYVNPPLMSGGVEAPLLALREIVAVTVKGNT